LEEVAAAEESPRRAFWRRGRSPDSDGFDEETGEESRKLAFWRRGYIIPEKSLRDPERNSQRDTPAVETTAETVAESPVGPQGTLEQAPTRWRRLWRRLRKAGSDSAEPADDSEELAEMETAAAAESAD
jgi:hypothetical protein